MIRFVVIGDIHGNERALKSALAKSDNIGYDQRIFIGDLLTYGMSVTPVVEKIAMASQMPNTVVLRGNHDLIYDELLTNASSPYKDGLPKWLQNSIDLTASQLGAAIWSEVNFQNSYISEGIYFSHANPFGPLNWRYLNTSADLQDASNALNVMGVHAGVFGHTHRMMLFQNQLNALPLTRASKFRTEVFKTPQTPIILNCGSVGQPRDRINREHILVIEADNHNLQCWFEPIVYDVAAHIADIRNSDLTPEAKERICNFHSQ